MKISAKGQVTIPNHIREQAGFFPNTEVEFVMSGKNVVLRKVTGRTCAEALIKAMRGSAGKNKMTTDQIMALTRGE